MDHVQKEDISKVSQVRTNRPKVGVAVVLVGGQGLCGVWLQKRKGSHGAGTYACPGGHIEFGNSIEETAISELKEEAGIEVKETFYTGVYTRTVCFEEREGFDYFTFWCVSFIGDEAPKIMEPDKNDGWVWVSSYDVLPKPLFQPIITLKESGFSLFDLIEKRL